MNTGDFALSPGRVEARASVISPGPPGRATLVSGMAFPHSHPDRRAPRILLGTSIPAVVLQQDGQRAKGKLATVSVTGGLLRLGHPLSPGDFVQVSFQMQSGLVQGLAEMLRPTERPNREIHQAFRFVAMGDDDHRMLCRAVDSATRGSN
jgi:hypothetical protein